MVEKLKTTRPENIILFGSYANGTPTNDNDLDILVVTGDDYIPSTFSEKNEINLKISRSISDIKKEFPIDLLVHTKTMHEKFIETNSLFAREIITNGKILYEEKH